MTEENKQDQIRINEELIRNKFRHSQTTNSVNEQALARTTLEVKELNLPCDFVAPTIAKHILSSDDPKLKELELRLWSSPGHVALFAIDKRENVAHLIDAAGYGKDSDVGITTFSPDSIHHFYGRHENQRISTPLTKNDIPKLGDRYYEPNFDTHEFQSISEMFE